MSSTTVPPVTVPAELVPFQQWIALENFKSKFLFSFTGTGDLRTLNNNVTNYNKDILNTPEYVTFFQQEDCGRYDAGLWRACNGLMTSTPLPEINCTLFKELFKLKNSWTSKCSIYKCLCPSPLGLALCLFKNYSSRHCDIAKLCRKTFTIIPDEINCNWFVQVFGTLFGLSIQPQDQKDQDKKQCEFHVDFAKEYSNSKWRLGGICTVTCPDPKKCFRVRIRQHWLITKCIALLHSDFRHIDNQAAFWPRNQTRFRRLSYMAETIKKTRKLN